MSQGLSVLNIGGHPKDVIMYAGGTMAKHVERGDKVCMLTPYTGVSHHEAAINALREGQEANIDDLIIERKTELNAAANELGVEDVRFLGYDDEITIEDKDIVSDIADIIQEIRPRIIVTHWPDDTVPAHALATRMTLLALDAASGFRRGKKSTPFGGDVGPEATQIFFHTQYGRTNLLETFNVRMPNTIIDISDVVQKKANAMNKFKSQHYGEDSPLQRKLGETLDGGLSAIHMRVPYAESFVSFKPQLYDALPISDYSDSLKSDMHKWTQMVL